MLINLTHQKHDDNVVEITFHSTSGDWFTALFPLCDVNLDRMRDFYVGQDFNETKEGYIGRIFSESDSYE